VAKTRQRYLNVIQITVQSRCNIIFSGGLIRVTGKIYNRERVPHDWFVMLTILVAIAVAVIAVWQASAANDEITGTVSQTGPALKQNGTPAHPYADASQCPANTDIIIWASGRSVPSMPPSISVCFVGNQPVEISGTVPVQMRDH
jgi:hypothetical protein